MNEQLIKTLLGQKAQLVAVTKKHSKEEVDALARLGCTTFGENRVQEFLEKYDPQYTWHIIGHLQRNKVKQVVGKAAMIESVDSLRLAQEIEKEAAKKDLIQDILVEIRISQDPNKTGLPLNELDDLLENIKKMSHVRLRGFMTIATNTEDKELVRKEFRQMKELFDQHKESLGLDVLSMGMSGDWPIALEEGATHLRVGSALFA
jgi:hypothetical protein